MVVGVLALQGSFNEHIAALKRVGVKGVEIRKPDQLQSVKALIIPGGESTTMAKLAEYHNLEHRTSFMELFQEKLYGEAFTSGRGLGTQTLVLRDPREDKLFSRIARFCKNGKTGLGTCAALFFWLTKQLGKKLADRNLLVALIVQFIETSLAVRFKALWLSFLFEIVAKEGGPPSFHGVFIRAPGILEVGPEVEVLAEVPAPSGQTTKSDPADESVEENAASEKKVIVAVKQGNLLATAFHPELTADTRWHSYFLKMVNEASQEVKQHLLVLRGSKTL
ncbi:hypothetical protein DH2020_000172 [Rehmannia glutinosa]|uniref:glutaminase n=1 Tax=Rehmannia glutinosa TaxID=99300 RepID=A0ABR0XVQ5_REHGL